MSDLETRLHLSSRRPPADDRSGEGIPVACCRAGAPSDEDVSLMCGIAGVLDLDASRREEELRAIVDAMRDTLVHRGPDAAGTWLDAPAGIALGHRRLSIVDLTEAGA